MASIYLKDIPKDVKDYILKKQLEIKIKKGNYKYSQELTIYHIIRENIPKEKP